MACDVPIVAAEVGSLKLLFRNHPEWLYKAGDVKSLSEVLEGRFSDRITDYPPIPTWEDLAVILEEIMLKVSYEEK